MNLPEDLQEDWVPVEIPLYYRDRRIGTYAKIWPSEVQSLGEGLDFPTAIWRLAGGFSYKARWGLGGETFRVEDGFLFARILDRHFEPVDRNQVPAIWLLALDRE